MRRNVSYRGLLHCGVDLSYLTVRNNYTECFYREILNLTFCIIINVFEQKVVYSKRRKGGVDFESKVRVRVNDIKVLYI